MALGHRALDGAGQERRDRPVLGVDLVPEQRTEGVHVLVMLTGAEPVALLEEGVRCRRGGSEVPAGARAPAGGEGA